MNDLTPREDAAKAAGLINFSEYVEQRNNMNNSLKLIGGGNLPPVSERWLEEMELGTIFNVIEKQGDGFVSPMFILIEKSEHLVKLMNPDLPHPMEVIPHRFRNKYRLVEIKGIYKNEEIDKNEKLELEYGNELKTITEGDIK